MSAWLTGWRLALRMARRDALKARARSALVLVMIALPVLGVTAAVVAQRTSEVSTVEGLDRTLGSAQGLVSVAGANPVPIVQDADASNTIPAADDPTDVTTVPALTASALSQALGGAEVLPYAQLEVRFETDAGVGQAATYQVDLADPMAAGLVDLRSGRLPRSTDEVVVNQALLDKGYAVGDTLRVADDPGVAPRIVGVAESTTVRDFPSVSGLPGSLPAPPQVTASQYLVGGAPISWDTVQRLNALGASVISRAVVTDPPPVSAIDERVRPFSSNDSAAVTVAVLVVTMALLEVVLLAGPAFAVGARRLQRSLALLAAAGGTPVQARRVVLAQAVVLGVTAAALGVVLGVLLAAALLPVLQRFSSDYLGPFEVPVLPLVGVAGFGLLSALLAAVVPAWIASRQDVVAVLAGRRGDAAPSRRSPVLGAVLLGVGVLVAVHGARGGGAETMIAVAALVSVLGMVLLVPVVVTLVARLASRLPLSLRYAARDAARHRTRTAPAVAAVAATVAGVVALLIANTSDGAQNEDTYQPSYAMGTGVATLSGVGVVTDAQVAALRGVLEKDLPGARITPVSGVPEDYSGTATTSTYTQLVRPGDDYGPLSSYGSSYGASYLVSDGALPPGLVGLSAGDRAAAEAALAAGGVVAFTDTDPGAASGPDDLVLSTTTSDNATGKTVSSSELPLSVTLVHVAPGGVGPAAILSPAAASAGGLRVGVTALVVDDTTITPAAETAVTEGLAGAGVDTIAGFNVERGYTAEDETLILQLVLIGLGAVLMLGGTLTATFLALADARPDLATLAAVGASPRRRRSVAAGYALVVGFVGAVLGAAVGFVPGVAVSFPLTRAVQGQAQSHYLDVPWLMIAGLVVVLPLLTAGIVALTARSRLPLVTRLD